MKHYRRRGARVKKREAHTVTTITSRLDHELCRDNPDNWHQSADGSLWCIHGNISVPQGFDPPAPYLTTNLPSDELQQ